MNIIISNSSGEPIYQQIVVQIKKLILSGELEEGDALPSMRSLAKDLRISVITTKRAYEELQQNGFIDTIVGKGSFVASKNTEFLREENLRRIEELLSQVQHIAAMAGIEDSEVIEIYQLLSGEPT